MLHMPLAPLKLSRGGLWLLLNRACPLPHHPSTALALTRTSSLQAVMTLFNAQIRSAVQAGIAGALRNDVPQAVNKVG